jgi:hypothetical protein
LVLLLVWACALVQDAAYLLTDRLLLMIGISMLIRALSAVSGYFVARSIA